jgi:hypothetical protein
MPDDNKSESTNTSRKMNGDDRTNRTEPRERHDTPILASATLFKASKSKRQKEEEKKFTKAV